MMIIAILIAVVMVMTLFFYRFVEKKWVKCFLTGLNIFLFFGLFFWAGNLIFPNIVSAADIVSQNDSAGLGYLAAGLAVGLASIGAGIGVGIAGSAAIGSISEKPEILGRTLIFIGLAEGVAIYGLIIAIMILGRI